MTVVRIASPHVPISVNKAYRNATSKDSVRGRIKTKDYATWFNAFAWDVRASMARQSPIKGPYTIDITIDRSKRHPLADIGNFEKVTQDALQACNVIENDKLCERVSIGWGLAGGGVEIEIRPWRNGL